MRKLINAYKELLSAVTDYIEYGWSGDPNDEDARVMGEMELDGIKGDKLKEYKKILTEAELSLQSTPDRPKGEHMNHHVIKAKDFTDFYGEVLIATNRSPFENKKITMKVHPLSGKQEFIVHNIKGNTFDVVYSLLDAIEKYNDI